MMGLLERLLPRTSRAVLRLRKTTRPTLEGLEDRMLLYSTNGGAWVYPVRVTYSFVPDGTSIGGVASNLYSTLNAETGSQAAWQGAIEQAAAIWETSANVNLALVSDNGAPDGTSGNQQDDPRFGDIRFSMIPMQSGVLAVASLPPPINGGTDAGDITFNSNINWGPHMYDLETVALHELGHALGLGHSTLSTAVMYPYYTGTNQDPTTDDINGIQAVYGPVTTANNSNTSIWTAWNLSPMLNSSGQIALANQSILGPNNADWWLVKAPANTSGTLTIQMQASNLSSLAPDLVVLDGYGNLLGQSNLPNAYGATASVTVTGVGPGMNFFIRNTAASFIGSNGAYGLLINFGTSPQAPIAPPNTVVASQPDQGGGSSFESVNMTTTLPGNLLPTLNLLPTNLGINLNLNQFVSALSGYSLTELGTLSTYSEPMTAADPTAIPASPHPTHRSWSFGGPAVTTHPDLVHSTDVVHLHASTPGKTGLPRPETRLPISYAPPSTTVGAVPVSPIERTLLSLRNRFLENR